jgi:HPt (histidine-containing phosphotransfer) domain-containing protein
MGTARKLNDHAGYLTIGCAALDVAFLNRNTFGDVALRREILGLFSAQANAAVTSLSLPMDAKAWAFLTHTLKGAASAVGAQQVAQLAEQWDRTPLPASESARQAVRQELSDAMAAFEAVAATLD